MSLTRRQMLNRTGTAGAGAVALGLGVSATTPAAAESTSSGPSKGGRLFPPLTAGSGDLLALPQGFAYEVVAVAGETELHDGTGKVIGLTPERADGTLAVAAGSGYRLVQNHEAGPGSSLPVPHVAGTVYDEGVLGGGCTVLDLTRSGRRRSEWVGLSGTISNCAGGPTPWGSWLTCEETDAKAGTGTLTKDHGYVFEVFADAPSNQCPLPIEAWGRAPHEAVVVEPSRTRVYLTEDASKPTGLLYRWTAPTGYRLRPHIGPLAGPPRRRPAGAGRARAGRQRAARPGLRHRDPDRAALHDVVEESPGPARDHDLTPQPVLRR